MKLEVNGKLSKKKSYATRPQRRAGADFIRCAGRRRDPKVWGRPDISPPWTARGFCWTVCPYESFRNKGFKTLQVLPLSFLQEAYKLEWGFMNPIRGDSDKALLKIMNGGHFKTEPELPRRGNCLECPTPQTSGEVRQGKTNFWTGPKATLFSKELSVKVTRT